MKSLNLIMLCVAGLAWPFAVQGALPFPAELLSQQAKLTAWDEALAGGAGGPSQFGVVALDDDTLVVGAVGNGHGERGAAYVFARSDGHWRFQAPLTPLDSAPDDTFGGALSLDDNTLVVGAPARETYKGAVYVFVRQGEQWTQQAKLQASDAAAYTAFGCSVGLSGTNLLIGAFGWGNRRGVVYAFERQGTNWVQRAQLLASDGVASDYFGYSLALDGTNLVVGAYRKDSWKGAAYVFEHRAAGWVQQAKLVASDGLADDYFGRVVALNGTNILVGSPYKASSKGAAYVFERQGTNWIQRPPLTVSDAESYNFGSSLAVSGTMLAVGADGWAESRGAVYFFVRQGGGWVRQSMLTAADSVPDDDFGIAVALTGTTLAVGALDKYNEQGAAYVFANAGTNWVQQAELTSADAGNSGPDTDRFGRALAVEGNTVVVGDTNQQGAAYVFTRMGPTAWAPEARLTAGTGLPGDVFGHAVSLSGDTVVAGAPGADHRRGAAYVFVRSGTGWLEQARLAADDGADYDGFGQCVAVSGDTVAVGAGYRESGRGTVYVFERQGANWTLQAKLQASDRAAGDYFGWAVGLEGNTLVVGAKGKGDGQGAAYVFVRDGANWVQQPKLLAADGTPGDSFGYSAAVSGTSLVVGACRKDGVRGAAYVFTTSGTEWTQQALLVASNGVAGDFFGGAVALSGDTVLVGAGRKGPMGAAYVFVRSAGTWSQQASLNPADSSAFAELGCAVALSGETGVVGADVTSERRGAAYLFTRSAGTWSSVDKLTGTERRAADWFAHRVALEGDILVAGAPKTAGGRGAGYVFARSGTNWLRQATLRASDGLAGDSFGSSVAVNGTNLVIGALSKGGPGAVYVFVRDGETWAQQAMLTPSDGTNGDWFGYAVALDGTNLVIGAPYKGLKGAVYHFVRDGGTWSQRPFLTPSDGATFDRFGDAVALSGTTLMVGAPHQADHRGSVYVFARQGAAWSQPAKLQPSDGITNSYFGCSLSLSGERALIGAFGNTNQQGAAYVYRGAGLSWAQEAKLLASDRQWYHGFGTSVALSGDTSVIGASGKDENQGVVYVFVRSGVLWREQIQLAAGDRAPGELFGGAVAISGETVVGGAVYDDANRGAAYVFTPGYGNATGVAAYTRKLLYVPEATAASPLFNPYEAAFRYKHFLYGAGTNGWLRAQFEKMSSFYYGDLERQRAKDAEDFLKRGLAHNPASDELGHLLLDLYYDRAVAETFFARDAVTNLTYLRFLRPIPPGGFLIDDEITACQAVLDLNRRALTNYVPLFNDDCGLPGQTTPLGCQVFQRLVPLRGLAPATYTNASGQSVPVTGNTNLLFTGYKDLVLLYDLLQEYGETTVELARLRIMNGDGEATASLQDLFADTHRFLTLHGTLWRGLFPNLTLPPDDPSGLAQAMAGVNDTLEDLETAQQGLRGRLNPLGFAPDFLMFVQNTDTFDSFDVLKGMLDPLLPGSGALVDARDKLLAARTSYADYRGYQDDLAAQFADSSISYMDRLRDIVGVFPDDPRYTDDPTAFSGSELNQQYLSIQQAHVRILRNNTEISNLKAQMEIELAKAVAVTNVMVDFGNRRANLTEIIGCISAAQAGANALAQMFSPEKLTGPGLFFGAVNVVAQVGGEIGKSQLEADKDRLAALEQATIVGLEAAVTVKKLLLDMNTLLVDSQEAALALQQEANRLQGLYREKQDLERKLAQRDARLAQRYFADPIHQLRVQSGIVRAEHAFARAQRWLFFMARALEYKWNEPFADTAYDGKPRTIATLFKLRNAEELVDFFNAMCEWDDDIQIPKDDRYDWFSVREDFFGYRAVDADGQPLLYPDPQTGQWLNATNAFRTNLVRRLQPVLGGQEVVIEFSTVREIPGGSFFVGPTFNTNGTVLYKGRYLDKINWLKIRLLGNHTGLPRPQLMGRLTYGGTSFIRKPRVGQFDLVRPDRMRDELAAYSTRYWYNLGQGWRFINALEIDDVFMELSNDPDVPPGTAEINEFKERSVAATGWVLAIPVIDEGTRVLNLDQLDDIKIYFYHYSAQRLEQ